MRSKELSFDDAFERVKAKRKQANPNHGFLKQLKAINFEFDRRIEEIDEKVQSAKI